MCVWHGRQPVIGRDLAYSELNSLSPLTALRWLCQAQLILLLLEVHSYW